MGRFKVYLVIFTALMVVYAAYAAWNFLKRKEKFTEVEEGSDGGSGSKGGGKGNYDGRLKVMSVFDRVFKRKPTDKEIDTYSTLDSEAKIAKAAKDAKDAKGAKGASASAEEKFTSDADDSGSDSGSDDESDDDSGSGSGSDDEEPALSPPALSPTAPAPASRTPHADAPPAPVATNKHIRVHKQQQRTTAEEEPQPYIPHATSTLFECGGGILHDSNSNSNSKSNSNNTVCLDRKDVLARLTSMSNEIKQFTRLVEMMG